MYIFAPNCGFCLFIYNSCYYLFLFLEQEKPAGGSQIHLVMEVSQAELIAQIILGILSGSLNLQLTNHVRGRLSGGALVPSHLMTSQEKNRTE